MPNNWERTILDGEWILGIEDNCNCKDIADSIVTGDDLKNSGFKCIKGSVPGNFELDLQRAGMIEEPFYGKNVLKMQQLEAKHLWYVKNFAFSGITKNAYIVFEGVDTFADVYLNGKKIAELSNMLIPHKIKADGLVNGDNEILVHIKPTCIVAREYELSPSDFAMKYNYASLCVRKAAHSFGWDIMPRVVSGGIWRSVYIIEEPDERIEEVFIYTTRIQADQGWATMEMFFRISVQSDSLKDYRIVVHGDCKDSRFYNEMQLWHNSGKLGIWVENPQLWWPYNLGEPNLYDTVVELYKGDKLLDTYTLKTGIRQVELIRTSTTNKRGDGEFCFKINGHNMFVMGTNWVPADAFHSRDRERLPMMLSLLKDSGCNAVRCWGGNVYEDDIFYDYCDQNGIVVWQDFAMGCAAYPQDKEFSDVIFNEVTQTVKRLRNHPSIILWAGDNECDYAFAYWGAINRDPNENKITRKVIPNALRLCDLTRPYIPSSPYIDETAYKAGFGSTPEEHLWGPRDYFKSSFYADSIAHFASEMGYHGCNSPKSIEKFISPEKLWPWQNNDEWIVHCASPEVEDGPFVYRIELMAKQIRELFGYIPDNLEEFALASQISQAEAFKFFIELFRTSKWRRTGIIWWNLIDGWPQFSDAVVDYYFTKKLAYSFIKNSQQPVCMMFKEPNNWEINLCAANDTLSPVTVKYRVSSVAEDERTLLEGSADIPANTNCFVAKLPYSMGTKHFYLIEWEYDGVRGKNHYLSGTPPYDLNWYIDCLIKAGLLAVEGFYEIN